MMLIHETQQTISDWAEATFGPVGSNLSVAARANREMGELLSALAKNDNHPAAPSEIADVVIVLKRLAHRMGVDLDAEVDAKMVINRQREWNLTDDGHGYHVRKPTTPPVEEDRF